MTDTPLASLKAIREAKLAEQVKRLRVGRYDDPQIVVSYRPLNQAEWNASFDMMVDPDLKDEFRVQTSKDANSDLLIKACTGIELRGVINANYGGFDPELGDSLGMDTEHITARRVCQELFLTDGDMIAHVNELTRWSNLTNQKVEEGFSGE